MVLPKDVLVEGFRLLQRRRRIHVIHEVLDACNPGIEKDLFGIFYAHLNHRLDFLLVEVKHVCRHHASGHYQISQAHLWSSHYERLDVVVALVVLHDLV